MKPSLAIPEAGTIFTFKYPFVRDVYAFADEDGVSKIATWKPGVRFENNYHGDTDTYADGLGQQTIIVIGSYKPGRYPLRIFYTRKWVDSDGKEFCKGGLRITTMLAFKNIIGGYRFPFEIKKKAA